MTGRAALLDVATRQWLALSPDARDSLPDAVRKLVHGAELSIWDRRIIRSTHQKMETRKPDEPGRVARELTLTDDCRIDTPTGLLHARKGDRLIFIPAERVQYPFSVVFPNGTETVMEDPNG